MSDPDDVPDPFIIRGSREYARATFALFCAGFTTFALLYSVQPLLPQLAHYFGVSSASSSLALFTAGFFAAHSVASGLIGQKAKKANAQASALYLSFYYLGSSVLGYAMGWVWQQEVG